MRLTWLPFTFVASVILVVACGDDDPGSDGGGSSSSSGASGSSSSSSSSGFGTSSSSSSGEIVSSLHAYAIAYCKKLQECTPVSFNESWDSKDTCVADVEKSNRDGQNILPGLSITQEQVNACAAEMAATSCAFARGDLKSCQRSGTLKDNTPCYDGSQCMSGRCKYADQANDCGTCTPYEATGGTCYDDGDCDFGVECFDGQCTKLLAKGDSCTSDGRDCVAGLVCAKGSCREPVDANGACTSSAECRRGLSCLDKVCKEKASKVAGLGEPCDKDTVCRQSSCRGKAGNEKCIAYATTAQACGDKLDGPADCNSDNNCFNGKCAENTFPTCN